MTNSRITHHVCVCQWSRKGGGARGPLAPPIFTEGRPGPPWSNNIVYHNFIRCISTHNTSLIIVSHACMATWMILREYITVCYGYIHTMVTVAVR